MTSYAAFPQPTVVAQTWRLYRFRGVGELLYIGQTAQVALSRLGQHLEKRWWAPLASGWEVDPRIFHSLAEVRRAERDAIRSERPRCNVVHNQHNRDRWESMADVPMMLRPVGVSVGPHRVPVQRERRPLVQSRARRRWTRRRYDVVAFRIRLAALALAWLVPFLAIWWVIGIKVAPTTGAGLSATLVSGLYVAAWRSRPRRGRRW